MPETPKTWPEGAGPAASASPPWEMSGLTVGWAQQEWSAMLWDTVSWRAVGVPGDRTHAFAEATDWLRDGLHPGQRITIACRFVGAWVLDDYGDGPGTKHSEATP